MPQKILNNKYLFLALLAGFLILIIGFIAPSITENYSNNWNSKFDQLKIEINNRVQNIINKNEQVLFNNVAEISENILQLSPTEITDYLAILNQTKFNNSYINIFQSGKLVGWNKYQIITEKSVAEHKNNFGNGKVFFFETPLITYLASISEVDSVQVVAAIPIEKNYKIKNNFYQNLSLIEVINSEFDVSVSIKFIPDEINENSYNIKNMTGKIIGSVRIIEFSKNADIQYFQNVFSLLQSVLVIIAAILALIWFNGKITFKYVFLKIMYFASSIIFVRIILSLLNVGKYFEFSDLVNPIYFSSTFAYGLTKSPLELFLTVIAVLVVSFKIYFTYINSNKFRDTNRTLKLLYSLIIYVLFILLYNGFASVLKSIIFDSSILYFKDASLNANFQTIFMYLNILLIGLITILLCIVLISSIINLTNHLLKIKSQIFSLIHFLIILLFIQIDEMIFNKSSILLSILFLLLAFVLTYYLKNNKINDFTKIAAILFSSSILSISFLNFFNTELEINSLKTIASELTRSNSELYEFYIDDALYKVVKDETLSEKISLADGNFNTEAFLLWTKTFLSSEVQASAINIIDANKNLLGSFEYRFNQPYYWNWGNLENKNASSKIDVFNQETSSKVITAITKINYKNKLVGYVEIIAVYNAYKFAADDNYKLISSITPFNKLSVNMDLLKIYEFQNSKLSNYFTNIFLTQAEEELIKNMTFDKNGEVWSSIKINGELNTFFLKKYVDKNGEKIIAVGLSNKDLTWNLFDFFKVFFIHSIMILFVFILLLLYNYKNWKYFRISFKSKILVSFLIVSIIPLMILASYFKNITDKKNDEATNYKLGKRADNVEEYINTYLTNSTLTQQAVFDKATKDLDIRYSLFENENLIYSSEGTYYRIGILPVILNPGVYLSVYNNGAKEVIAKENIDKLFFNTLYHKSNIRGENYIIKVSDLFNYYQLPMSGLELNVFLFGTYSLAIIFIILLSTILANQISSPIEKLTKATRSVARGDMNIQLQNNESGEVKELINGFNQMVLELKKNQLELAEVERESAWREMAKQVAHEIKNPLTPMKLAVQHLVAAHNDKSDKYNSIFEKVTSTIINQIDILKNIASEFSNFAKMPSLKLESVDIIAVSYEIIDLFIEEDCSVNIIPNTNKIIILSDKEQFQRMIINLIRNSIQANAKQINIIANLLDKKVELFICDDGDGIKSNIISNIFDENFTTKKSGMGLGLALIKRFLNQTNGEISVEKSSNEGTTIKIEIKIDG